MHLHEPVAPVVGWDALTSADAPLVGTFHCYSENVPPQRWRGSSAPGASSTASRVRIAVSEAAAWTGRRFYGGEYRVVPNGVELPAGGAPAPRRRSGREPLRIVFVGQAVERKGLPVLLRAFEALREHVPARLTIVGAAERGRAAAARPPRRHRARPRRATRRSAPRSRARRAGAPSLGGESFGMVLTEAFAAGTPGRRLGHRRLPRRRRDGVDGVLVPRGDAAALAEALRDLALDPRAPTALGNAAARSAERYAWPRVAAEVVEAYEDALAVPEPEGAVERAAVRIGVRAGRPRPAPPRAPAAVARARPAGRGPARAWRCAAPAWASRRAGRAAGSYLALQRIGVRPDQSTRSWPRARRGCWSGWR